MTDKLKEFMETRRVVCVYLFRGQLGRYKCGWIEKIDEHGIELKERYTCCTLLLPFSSIQGISDAPII